MVVKGMIAANEIVPRLMGGGDIPYLREALEAGALDPSQVPASEVLLHLVNSFQSIYTLYCGLVLGGPVQPPIVYIDAFYIPRGLRGRIRSLLREAAVHHSRVARALGATQVVASVSWNHPHRDALLSLHRSFGLSPVLAVSAGSLDGIEEACHGA